MSLVHTVVCDMCGKKVKAEYNGEHCLAPKGWAEIFESREVTTSGQHLCPKCRPKKEAEEGK